MSRYEIEIRKAQEPQGCLVAAIALALAPLAAVAGGAAWLLA